MNVSIVRIIVINEKLTQNILFVEEHEYCLFETFYGRCPSDEIIMITHAQYGRMRVGKCIAEGLSNIIMPSLHCVLAQQQS